MEAAARRIPPVAIVALVAGLLFFSRLDLPLLEPQEARYAEIPRAMLANEEYLTPVLQGQPYFDKPPLLYWCTIASYRLFGVHDWAARLVPALAAWLTVLIIYGWGRAVIGEREAFVGALILALSARFAYLARMLTFDSVLCCFTTAALAAGHCALRSGGCGWGTLSAIACALGVLTKGPVAVVLVLPLLFLRPRWHQVLLYVSLVALVSAPWFFIMMARHPEFAEHFFWRHHVVRYVEPFDHAEPFWFHLPGLLLGMLPWTLLLPGLLRSLNREDKDRLFLTLASGWAVLFFSLSGCKRAVYILPALPPLALALGSYLVSLRAVDRLARSATLCVLVGGAGLSLAAAMSGLLTWPVAVAMITVGTAAALNVWRAKQAPSWTTAGIVTFGSLFLATHLLLPAYHERFALRTMLRAYGNDEFADGTNIVCYPKSWDSVSYYLRRPVKVFGANQQDEMQREFHQNSRTLLITKTGRTLDGFLRTLPPTLQYMPDRRAGFVQFGWVVPVPAAGDVTAQRP